MDTLKKIKALENIYKNHKILKMNTDSLEEKINNLYYEYRKKSSNEIYKKS